MFNDNESNYSNDDQKEHNINSKIEFNFSNNQCNEYFSHQYNNENGDSYLVSNSCFDGEVHPNKVDETEKQLILLIPNLSMILTKDEKLLLTSILVLHECVIRKRCNNRMNKCKESHDISKKRSHSKEEELNTYCKVKIPNTPAQLRSMTNNRKKSVMKSLPIPTIKRIGDHTYLSIIDIISDILAHGFKVATITLPTNGNSNSLCTSPYVNKVNERGNLLHEGYPVINLFIIEWSDAFEPNNMKNNRNSVWVKTVTISPVNGKTKNSHHNTYPLSFGPKNSSHESVEKLFKNDLLLLKSGSKQLFYNAISKSMCRVHAELIISIQDQPERRAENHIALGKSNYTPCWGYLLHVNKVKQKIVPCDACEEVLLSNNCQQHISNKLFFCKDCTSWDYLRKSNILEHECPKEYPPGLDRKLFPKKQSFEQLTEATSMVHKKRILGEWNKEQSRCFMTSEGLNTVTQNEILYNAANCTVLNNWDNEDVIVQNAITRELERNYDSFSEWTCSS